MKVEVVEFYPQKVDKKKHSFEGTLHVYLCDYDIDLRGILVKKTSKSLFCVAPSKLALDEETKKMVRYPVFQFTSKEKNREMMQAIRAAAMIYISKQMKPAIPSRGGRYAPRV